MGRRSRRATRATWEVDIVRIPDMSVEDANVRGLLIVVERKRGIVRHAAPVEVGEPLTPHLLAAAEAGVHHPSQRPTTIRCTDAILGELKRGAKVLGAKLTVAASLPAADAAADGLIEHFRSVAPPDLRVSDPAPWRAVLHALLDLEPWERIDEEVAFVLNGPRVIDGWACLVIGGAGEQRGLVFFPDIDAIDLMEGTRPGELPQRFVSVCVHLDYAEDLPGSYVAWAIEAGWVLRGQVLTVFRASEEGMTPLTDPTPWLAATQAVLSLCASASDDLAVRPVGRKVETPIGEVAVRTQFRDELEEERFVEVPHQMFFEVGDDRKALCFKAAKRDAEHIASDLRQVRNLRVIVSPNSIELAVELHHGEHLSVADLPFHPGLAKALSGEVTLVAMKGGAKRRSYRDSDILREQRVPVVRPAPSEMLDPDWAKKADYSGPVETWPKASTVLLAFAGPLDLEHAGRIGFKRGVLMATAIWNAVVLADVIGDSGPLASLEGPMGSGGDPLLATMVASKRARYAQDTRLLEVHEVHWAGGQANVLVKWTDARRA